MALLGFVVVVVVGFGALDNSGHATTLRCSGTVGGHYQVIMKASELQILSHSQMFMG